MMMKAVFVALALVATIGGASSLYISGLQGQQFHFDGQSGHDFNIITTPNFQINAKFKYLEKATRKCNYTDTSCFSHSGTYLSELGITINSMPRITMLKLVSDSHENGFQLFSFDGQSASPLHLKKRLILTTPDEYHVSVLRTSKNQIVVNSLFFKLTIANSDHFFNVAVAMHDDNVMKHGAQKLVLCGGDGTGLDGVGMIGGPSYPHVPAHGIIGQTWRNAVYCGGLLYEGQWDDYEVKSLFDNDFRYNEFVSEKNY